MIAGFEDIHAGSISIHNSLVSTPGSTTPPEHRSIGMVFQDYALFPHMTVRENLEFGIRKKKKDFRQKKTADLLDLVGLQDCGPKYPHELSGGQQQRIALARALAPEPDLLLLDEPFSNLDALLRDKLTVEVRDILKSLGTTALLVTHNQHEAFSVADMVGILFNGKMQQWDSAYNIYHNPTSLEVATFVGDGSLISGRVTGKTQVECGMGKIKGRLSLPCEQGCAVYLLIRPEDVLHVEDAPIRATISHKSFRGPNILYQLKLPTGEYCQALVSSHHNHAIGEAIGVTAEADNLVVFPQNAEGKVKNSFLA
jgi:iron(III) transport system ATP-binding protein